MSWTTTNQASHAQELYTSRASEYDEANSGWHIRLGQDFTDLINPQPGETVLDLACGTGLVTFPMASRVGSNGLVVGVDVTKSMLDIARSKYDSLKSSSSTQNNHLPRIDLVEADITSAPALTSIPSIQEILRTRGGFDIIANCSCLVLLPDPASAIKLWSSLLRPKSGRMIIDVVTSRMTLQYLTTEILAEKLSAGGDDVSWPFSRAWVKDIRSLEGLMLDAGLEIESSREYSNRDVPELNGVYEASQGMEVIEKRLAGSLGEKYKGREGEVREVWPGLWEGVLGEDGRFHDSHDLFITIGRKKAK